MTPTLEMDGNVVTAADFAAAPPTWVLGRIYGGNTLSRAKLYVSVLNQVPPARALRAKDQHVDGEIHFQL